MKKKMGVLSISVREKIAKRLKELYDVDPSNYVPPALRYTCYLKDLCVIYGSKLNAADLTVLYEDSWIALYIKKQFIPSISIVRSIYSNHGVKSAIIVGEQGIKAFLYGNDVLPDSVISIIPPAKDLYAVIDSSDDEIVGFASWDPIKKIYANIFDIGMFLRVLG